MNADVTEYINKLASQSTEAEVETDKSVSFDSDYVEKLASAVEFLVAKATGEPVQTEGSEKTAMADENPNAENKDDSEKADKAGKPEKSEKGGPSLDELLKKKLMAAKKRGKGKEESETPAPEKKDADSEDKPKDKEASDLQSQLTDAIKEKVAEKNSVESSLIHGILARMSLTQDENAVAPTSEGEEKIAKETKPEKEELGKSASEESGKAEGLTLAGLVEGNRKETELAVESASSDGTKTAASRVSSDLSTLLKNSILSKVGRSEA